MCKVLRLAGRRARRQPGSRGLRRLGFREGLPGREALSRREDWQDLRRHLVHAARDDREADAGQGIAARILRLYTINKASLSMTSFYKARESSPLRIPRARLRCRRLDHVL